MGVLFEVNHLFVERHSSMAKRRGNPNWGKPEPIGPVVPTITRPVFAFHPAARVGAPQQEFKVHPRAASGSVGLRDRVHTVD